MNCPKCGSLNNRFWNFSTPTEVRQCIDCGFYFSPCGDLSGASNPNDYIIPAVEIRPPEPPAPTNPDEVVVWRDQYGFWAKWGDGLSRRLSVSALEDPPMAKPAYDAVRESVLGLPQKEQEKLYRWMYDALGCRR